MNYALFGGGYSSSIGGYLDTVDSYDFNLTRGTPAPLSVRRGVLAATTVGNYALFGGGEDATAKIKVVDAYTFV